MAYNRDQHHRRSMRLRGYDYAQAGAYFVTICMQHRACCLGSITDETMQSSAAGQMVETQWQELPRRFPQVELDEYVVMPNHFHGIIVTESNTNAEAAGATIGDIVGAFKSITTNAYSLGVKHQQWAPFDRRLWQRNFYEHIIRSEKSLWAIREYIAHNPINWPQDEWFHP